jgi:hypothetical protein
LNESINAKKNTPKTIKSLGSNSSNEAFKSCLKTKITMEVTKTYKKVNISAGRKWNVLFFNILVKEKVILELF